MAAWNHGYVTDIPYTPQFHRETTPNWLAIAGLLLGHRPPDLAKPFAYADIGCGPGLTALTVAATSPHADVWAFDFNPAHIESGRAMADAAGLTNIHFVEASFDDIAAMPAGTLPAFDFMVAHGVLSWVSQENAATLIRVMGQRLRPGGLAYVSYNTGAGWAGMGPLRLLMHQVAQATNLRSDLAVPAMWDYLDRLKQGGASYFQAHPNLETRLEQMRRQDPRYLAHEFLNEHWRTLQCADVFAAMADVKCTFIGSSSLPDNIDAFSVPPGLAPLMAEARDPIMRETLRDLATQQSFRRDIFRRGTPTMPQPEHHALLDKTALGWTGQTIVGDVIFRTPLGNMTGKAEAYRPLMDRLQAGPMTIGEARSVGVFPNLPLVELLQGIALLLGGFAHPVNPGDSAAARQATARLNRAIAATNAAGAEIPLLATSALGTAPRFDVTDTLMVGDILAGMKADAETLGTALGAHLRRSGRTVQREGQPVTDPAETRALAIGMAQTFLDERLPTLRRLGILEG